MSDTRYIGDDIDVEIPPVVDAYGKAVDLTGAAIYASAKGPTATIPSDQFFVDDPVNGAGARVRWRSATTAAFAAGTYSYDVVAKLGDLSVHTIGWGSFQAKVRVTPTP